MDYEFLAPIASELLEQGLIHCFWPSLVGSLVGSLFGQFLRVWLVGWFLPLDCLFGCFVG